MQPAPTVNRLQHLAAQARAVAPALRNIAAYLVRRTAVLALTVTAAVYLTILIANLGGYVDRVVAANIDFAVALRVRDGWLRGLPLEERDRIVEETAAALRDAAGLNDPFLWRTFRWLTDGLTLNWGETSRASSYSVGRTVRDVRGIVLENLSRTLLIFGLANLLLFGVTVSLALVLTRFYGGRLDWLFSLFAPLSAAPAWVYGVVLNILLFRLFRFSIGGTLDAWPDQFSFTYAGVVLRHLLPVVAAIFLNGLFQGVYVWRSFFFVFANEDYVEMARLKGLKPGLVERRYILRPALPGLITSFALLLMALWQEVIALEYFFNVSGIGRVFLSALRFYDTPMIVALVVTFAYLLAVTVLALDLVYAFVDPRIQVGARQQEGGEGRVARFGRRRLWRRRQPAASPPRPAAVMTPVTAPPPIAAAVAPAGPRPPRNAALRAWLRRWTQELRRYPSAVVGLALIALLVAASIYTPLALPYDTAVARWRGDGAAWARNPRDAQPAWTNLFRREKLPQTLVLSSDDPAVARETAVLPNGSVDLTFEFPIDYRYAAFPQDLIVDFQAAFVEKSPHIELRWSTPDGRDVRIDSLTVKRSDSYIVSQDRQLKRRLRDDFPQQALFMEPGDPARWVLPGLYTLRVTALLFEPDSALEVTVHMLGQVHGLAGTDALRRDLTIPLLWGAPIALLFGLAAATATSVFGMALAAVSAWLGGWVDRLVQALTEVNLIVPFFPVSLMIYTLYSKSIWMILAVTVALSVFSSQIKTYRAVFLQVKQLPYVEAARAYGVGHGRMVVRYLMPRIVGVLIPRLVILAPGYIFLEATLAFLGVSDPVFPTWGKLTAEALSTGVNQGSWHTVGLSLGVLFLTGFAFAMLGMALERIYEPRLREL